MSQSDVPMYPRNQFALNSERLYEGPSVNDLKSALMKFSCLNNRTPILIMQLQQPNSNPNYATATIK